MSDLVASLATIFAFLVQQMTSIAAFFVTSTLGQVILAVALFTVIVYLIGYVINSIR